MSKVQYSSGECTVTSQVRAPTGCKPLQTFECSTGQVTGGLSHSVMPQQRMHAHGLPGWYQMLPPGPVAQQAGHNSHQPWACTSLPPLTHIPQCNLFFSCHAERISASRLAWPGCQRQHLWTKVHQRRCLWGSLLLACEIFMQCAPCVSFQLVAVVCCCLGTRGHTLTEPCATTCATCTCHLAGAARGLHRAVELIAPSVCMLLRRTAGDV